MGCLKQLHKIRKRKDFTACYANGDRLFSKNFIVRAYQKDPSDPRWRFGLAVSKKVGSAVKRNRIKRLLREFFRIHQTIMPKSIDVVVIPKVHISKERMDFHQVTKELAPIFYRLNLESKKNGSSSLLID